MKFRYSLSIVFLAFSLLLISWGYTGHRTIGELTSMHLNPNASAAVKQILGEESLAEACTWADKAREFPELKETASWHFINLPLGLNYREFTTMLDTMKQENVYSALLKANTELRRPDLDPKERLKALHFLLHFVGDAHQPMHVSRAEDKGGNTIQLNYEGKGTNLHSVTDTKLLEQQGLKYPELAKAFDHISKRKIRRWQRDPIIKWVWESYQISSALYKEVDEMKDRNIGEAYYKKHMPMVEKRIQQASIRLAGLLNEIFANGVPE